MGRKHAIRNASGAKNWMYCAWVARNKIENERLGIHRDTSSTASKRGTRLHDILEAALTLILSAPGQYLISDAIGKFEHLHEEDLGILTDEDREQTEIALQAALDLLSAFPGINVLIEQGIVLSHEPESKGFVDLGGFTDSVVLVADYKMGQMAVPPDSEQNLIYAANLVLRLQEKMPNLSPETRVVTAIIQPRHAREALTYETTVGELTAFRHFVEGVAARQASNKDTRPASQLSTCTFCEFAELDPFTGKPCQARLNLLKADSDALLGGIENDGAYSVEIEEIVVNRTELANAIKSCVEIVQKNPAVYPGWQRIEAPNPRKWIAHPEGEAEIAHLLRRAGADDVYALKTPAKIKSTYPELVETVDELSQSEGSHIRLKRMKALDAAEDAEEASAKKASKRKKSAKKAAKKKGVKKAATKKKTDEE